LLEEDVTRAVGQLHQQARRSGAPGRHGSPRAPLQGQAFRFFRRLVNYDPTIADAAT
jgi:hypothetical protein